MSDIDEHLIERFSAYFDDEMSDDERAALEAELDSDPALQERFEKFVDTKFLPRSETHRRACCGFPKDHRNRQSR